MAQVLNLSPARLRVPALAFAASGPLPSTFLVHGPASLCSVQRKRWHCSRCVHSNTSRGESGLGGTFRRSLLLLSQALRCAQRRFDGRSSFSVSMAGFRTDYLSDGNGRVSHRVVSPPLPRQFSACAELATPYHGPASLCSARHKRWHYSRSIHSNTMQEEDGHGGTSGQSLLLGHHAPRDVRRLFDVTSCVSLLRVCLRTERFLGGKGRVLQRVAHSGSPLQPPAIQSFLRRAMGRRPCAPLERKRWHLLLIATRSVAFSPRE